MANKNGDLGKFKRALDQQNQVERGRSSSEKHQRDAAEGKAAHHGPGALEEQSKGRPKQGQAATTRKSPQSARSQSR
ncbi:hypothetical protein [Dongia sp. agr-C8]